METILGVALNQYQPSLFFCAGVFMSVSLCLLSVVVEPAIRRRQFDGIELDTQSHRYHRYRRELIQMSRHVGFTADEVHELNDDDLHAD